MNDERSIELEVTVPGTPEEVWDAIATGPGITSWFVPHTVEEREGGRTESMFGPGDEMRVEGIVRVWDPPRRVVFGAAEGDDAAPGPGMAFEWLVEARDGATCIVRLVNSGFGQGDDWDAQYDAMTEGWKLFLHNLELHLTNFGGRRATPLLPTAQAAGGRSAVWADLCGSLGVAAPPQVGDRLAVGAEGTPSFSGTVQRTQGTMISLLLDSPAPGTAFLAVEGAEDVVSASVWLYLYGDDASAIAERDEPRWQTWLDTRFRSQDVLQ